MDNTLINRINELAEKSYSENRFVFTDFLDMSQLSAFYSLERDLEYVGTTVSGGTEGCERCMVRFGSPDSLGYDEAFPIVLLHISPVQKKFSDTLTHRDFLGSVIGLGIERTKLGDIIVRDNEGYIFVSESISEYILENLSKVKHTNVRVEKCLDIPEAVAPKFAEESIIVSSNRLDAIIARVYKLSRDLAVRYISEGKVFLSGRQMTENAKQLKAGDIVSVRGKGKFIFEGEGGNTRKDKLYINIKKYV
jgi:RNA-binding protein YlmH